MSDYKHPEVLVSTDWAAQNLNSPNLRFVEVDVDTTAYDQGHIPGAVGWNWQTQLQDNIRRDLIDKSTLERLLSASGISNDTTILLYGEPVVVVAVEKNGGVIGNAGGAEKSFERGLVDQVAADVVLELGLPVPADCAGNVPLIVGGSVYVDLDQAEIGRIQILSGPIDGN